MPLALSQCNPTRRGVCGGGRTCFRLGVDDVGGCYTSCNPFQQSCARIDGKGAGCYVSFDTGEAGCLIYNVNAEGAPCRFLNDCNPGLMCWSGACRPYCGGPQARACANGKKCIAFSSAVPITTAGVCGG
jgi:hypothetical protein